MLASLVAGAIAIRLRLRRSTGVERLQTLWLAWAASLRPARSADAASPAGALGDSLRDVVLGPILLGMPVALAVAIGIAVTRHRLYAIERLVNRTLVYGALTLLLVAAYVAIALVVGRRRSAAGRRG